MRTFRIRVSVMAALLLAVGLAVSPAMGDAKWLESYDEAIKMARESGKPVMINFTGSDWCGWCIRLDREVFATSEFAKWSSDNVVLLKLDFPRRTPDAEQLQRRNRPHLERYGVRGFPTILFITAEGEAFGRTGYVAGGPEPWIAQANQQLENRPRPATIETTSDLERAVAQAKSQRKPLLVLADVGAERTEAFDKLINDAALAGVANDHFVVVHVQRSGEKATPQADVDRAVKLLDDLEAEKGDGRLAVVDVSGRQPRLRWSASKVPEAADMRITLIKQMPRVPYRGGWIENYSQAQIIAAQTGRPIMLYFTGSDWCPPCQAFDRNILSTREFMAYARENLVLVKLDFPRNAPQSEEQKRHNQQVQRQYEVRGFPTMIFMDPKGKELDKTVGFPGGTPAAFVERLKKAAEG